MTSTRGAARASGGAASSGGSGEAAGSSVSAAEDPDIEARQAEAAAMAWGQPAARGGQGGGAVSGGGADLDVLSLDDLQAELARRKEAKQRQDA